MSFAVRLIKGPNRGNAVAVDPAVQAPIIVGREPTCDLVVNHPAVEPRHIALVLSADGLIFNPIVPTGRVFKNGVEVAPGTEFIHDEEFSLPGGAILKVIPAEAGMPTAGASVAMAVNTPPKR